ncbi:MAG: DinB family protein [Planctomycetota bacterium]
MSTGTIIAATGRLTFSTAQQMLGDIPADRFGRLPAADVGVVPTNHPAWVYGHLGLYGPHILTFLGDERADRLAAPDGWVPLFGMGSTCSNDVEGTHYPPMSEIVEQFNRSYEAALDATQRADDAVFEKAQPREDLRERFPTVGAFVNFMLTTHVALHVGQVSAWRRIEGMGSALGF